ncbi:hypothetical protein BH09CHL1_BH09CHL1_19840 [soil metagenome]
MNDAGTFEAMAIEQLRVFFANYGLTRLSSNESAFADCYDLPAFFISDSGSLPIATVHDLESVFHAATERYVQRGFATAEPTLGRIDVLSTQIVTIDVDWDYRDAQGNHVDRESYRYLLRIRPNDNIRIQVVITRTVS